MVLSLDDEPWRPSPRLLNICAQLAAVTPNISHPLLDSRAARAAEARWYKCFPGEHYHLLTALASLLKPAIVWEFGTDTGMSAVALLEGLDQEATLYTVDIDSWKSKRVSWLIDADFSSRRVTQVVSDMKAPGLFSQYKDKIADAGLLFVDGPKDGFTEAAFLTLLGAIPFRRTPIVVFDDIRLMNMLQIWRGIQRHKMDMTSYGHWSGTGLVDWSPSKSSLRTN